MGYSKPLAAALATLALAACSNGNAEGDKTSTSTDLPVHACAEAVGTYLTTDKATEPDSPTIDSRSLIALTNGGHVMFIDSGEGGAKTFAPFTDALGRWTCLSQVGEAPRLKATALDFTLPVLTEGDAATQQIARVDFTATVDPASGVIEADAILAFVPLNADPYGDGATDGALEWQFSGYKIEVPE